jgi:anti-sigma factor RsiW
MTDYLDGRLETEDRERLELHLAGCPHCSEYLAQLRVTVDALGVTPADALSDEALDELVALYRRWQADPADN